MECSYTKTHAIHWITFHLHCPNLPWFHPVVLLYFITIIHNFSNFEESIWIVTPQNVEACVIFFIIYKLTRDSKWWRITQHLYRVRMFTLIIRTETIRWTAGHVGLWKNLSPSAKSKASNVSRSCLVGKLWQNHS